jgi:hypothetical protein
LFPVPSPKLGTYSSSPQRQVDSRHQYETRRPPSTTTPPTTRKRKAAADLLHTTTTDTATQPPPKKVQKKGKAPASKVVEPVVLTPATETPSMDSDDDINSPQSSDDEPMEDMDSEMSDQDGE